MSVGNTRSGSGRRRSARRFDDEPRDGLLSDLVGHLHALDDRSYAAYRAIVGRYEAQEGWILHIDRVQADPFAPPSEIRIEVPLSLPGLETLRCVPQPLLSSSELSASSSQRSLDDPLAAELIGTSKRDTTSAAGLTEAPDPAQTPHAVFATYPTLTGADLLATHERRVAVTDFLTRELRAGFRGTDLSIAAPGQEILERSSILVMADDDAPLTAADVTIAPPVLKNSPRPADPGVAASEDSANAADAASVPAEGTAAASETFEGLPQASHLEIRARLQLPARGRSIQGRAAARTISLDLPRALNAALNLTGERLERLLAHVAVMEDHAALTRALDSHGWVAFLADGALLPRRSGVSEEPLREGAVPLTAPESLAAVVSLPHAGQVRGTAIGSGVTLIVGGGYHGKSTLLSAIERGVYPHIPGDGRELVATLPSAVKVRAADGRAVTGVDLTPFISHLPAGRDTTRFTTKNASGSTSQAASIIEAIEAGASALLLDEDTSATNLLIRDERMRALVADEREPITPLVDRIQALATERDVATVLVMGGSGDYLDIADRVLLMDNYVLRDATDAAQEVIANQPRALTVLADFPEPMPRHPLPSPPRTRRGPVRTRSRGLTQITLDREDVDVSDVAGLVDPGQTEAVAYALRALLEQRFDGESSLARCLADLDALLDDEGLDALNERRPAFFARPRMVDVAAAVNRYRSLEVAE